MSKHRPGNPRHAAVRRARSLRELPQEMMPERDLWPQIQARLSEAPQAQTQAHTQAQQAHTQAQTQTQGGARAGWRLQLAAAAVLLVLGAALTLGVWITHGSAIRDPLPRDAAVDRAHALPGPVDARENAALLRSLNARLEALPPPSRQKVLADLAVIEKSMRDIQSALGRDPSNALLREMLLESYQDEQQLIATVQEAGTWTREAGIGKGSI